MDQELLHNYVVLRWLAQDVRCRQTADVKIIDTSVPLVGSGWETAGKTPSGVPNTLAHVHLRPFSARASLGACVVGARLAAARRPSRGCTIASVRFFSSVRSSRVLRVGNTPPLPTSLPHVRCRNNQQTE